MSLQQLKLSILRSLSLSTGLALLLTNTGAIAAPRNSYDDEPEIPTRSEPEIPTRSSPLPPVVVDTEPVPTGRTTTSTPIYRPPSTNGSSIPVSESQARFSCQLLNGQYTVMYHPESQPDQYFPWATPSVLGGGWTSERRCNEISRRLESYRPDGLLEIRTDVANNYNTICVTTQNVPSCRIVLTVPPGQDPVSTRDRVFQNLTVADSGQQTTAVNTYVGGSRSTGGVDQIYNWGQSVLGGKRNRRATSNNINLQPFLDRADGGTGSQLVGGVSKPANPRLNPDRFR